MRKHIPSDLKKVWLICRHPENKKYLVEKTRYKKDVNYERIINYLAENEDFAKINYTSMEEKMYPNSFYGGMTYINALLKICKENGIVHITHEAKNTLPLNENKSLELLQHLIKSPEEIQDTINDLKLVEERVKGRIKIKKNLRRSNFANPEQYLVLGDISEKGLKNDEQELIIIGIKIDILEKYLVYAHLFGETFFLSLILKIN